ncbi:MAG: single-stranded-DNA-specific exonuclease RecJ [Proteobacteria bacterium]|nr:single-stranded-DNA-specific exonuclease RecJ [Pseudomonadota bacterium]
MDGDAGGKGAFNGDGFLGVERSVSGRRWVARAGDTRLGLALAQRLGLPEIVGRLLAARGVGLDEAEAYLAPTLRTQLPDPSGFRDMDRAAERLAVAIRGGEEIAIFGDYDVDGATSSAVLARFFAAVSARHRIYIPDRLSEGYGPNTPALRKLQADGVRVVVTVDCGATAHEPLAAAAACGLDVIVCDHHVGEPALPPAFAVVNPNRFDETTPHRQLAAVGVAFLMAVAVNRRLRSGGWYTETRREPDLLQLLDLVALGTVADVVPLTGVNRALVIQGLRVLARRANPGLAALADVAGLDERADAYHLGYVFGPRVNAGGRVGNAALGARLLTTDDEVEARSLARELHALNDERRAIEATVLEAAIAQVEGAGGLGRTHNGALVFASGADWHPGVIGIVAARLKDRYNRPAVVTAIIDGIAKGSARSVPGFAIGDAVLAARQAGLLVNGGGHAMAAGFTAEAARLDALEAFLHERAATVISNGGVVPRLSLDGALDAGAATPALVEQIGRLGPFGSANTEPRFAVPAARIVRADVVGEAHVRCVLTGALGGRLKAIAFRALETPLGKALLSRDGAPLHVAGHLRADSWQGRDGCQLIIDDAAAV